MNWTNIFEWFSNHIGFFTLLVSTLVFYYSKKIYNVHQSRYNNEITPYVKCRTAKDIIREKIGHSDKFRDEEVPIYKKLHIYGFNAPSHVIRISAKLYNVENNEFIANITRNNQEWEDLSLVVHPHERESYYFDQKILPSDGFSFTIDDKKYDIRTTCLMLNVHFSGFKNNDEFSYTAKFKFSQSDETHIRSYWQVIEENYCSN